MKAEKEMLKAENSETIKTQKSSRQPFSSIGRIAFWTSVAGFLSSLGGAIAITIGTGAPSRDIVITTGCWLIVVVLLATRLRWASLVATLVAGYNLYVVSVEPYVIDSVANPKGPNGGYGHFIGVIVALALAILVLVCSLGAAIQNYRGGSRQAPRWLPSALGLIAGMVIGALFIGALVSPAAPAGLTYTNGVPTIHMDAGSFIQTSVTITKGSSLILMDDSSAVHILANGSWQNGQAKAAQEAGAPLVNNKQVSSSSIEIGPFTVAGTYHIYCLVHSGMNLTVTVQ